MFLSSKSRALHVPIPPTASNASLVKSPGSYTSPETASKSLLLGSRVPSGKDSFTDADYSRIDPDDMFVRYSVSEIRVIRARLLADADGKREELRQMVGERYRDLLHASTAITNMAGTSERVVGALNDMRESCASVSQLDETPRARHRSAPNGKSNKVQEDAHLKTLQILSAHLKLLLDSPEHLWRWLEKKQFLHAAWLFLLARTVHRKLSRSIDDDDSEDEENEGGDINWSRHGIDIGASAEIEQFPIAARQWEAIGQFRPQIVHKATQALREPGTSHRGVAETLIAILLLDALSTARTRSLFFSQRGKTLAVLLNPPLAVSRRAISPSRAQNRKATAALLSPASPAQSLPSPSIQLLKTPVPASVETAKAERKAVREVVKSFRAIFELIGGTLATVRAIYGSEGLLAQLISDIQSDVPDTAALPSTASQPHFPSSSNTQLPVTSHKSLTTPQILQSLPSASLLLRFLPSSIIGYTPYISSETNDSGVESDETEQEAKVWMDMALEALEAPAKAWLARLESVRAVWTVRNSVIKGIASLEGTHQVKERLESAVEVAFAARVAEVWERRLETVEIVVGSAISKALAVLLGATGEEEALKSDLDPLGFVYSSELPSVQGDVNGDSSFQRFKATLARRVSRRTPLLDSVLSEMEETARELKEELTVISAEEQTNEVAARLTSTYQPRAGQTSNAIIFVGRLANSLANGSPFVEDLSCSRDTAEGKYPASVQSNLDSQYSIDAINRLKGIHQESIQAWCESSAEKALSVYQPALEASPSSDANISLIVRPSNHLVSALRSLMTSIDSLGLTLEQLRAERVAQRVFDAFETLLSAGLPVEHVADQTVWDIMFIKEIRKAAPKGIDETEQNDASNKAIESHLQKNSEEIQTLTRASVKNQLCRSQLLLSTLLDLGVVPVARQTHSRTQNAFLSLGVPPQETDFRPALELAKPGQRFGMLPVAAVAYK